ncbi:hypothetical protein [Pelagovum pacificum]|uniref:Uncharacterized protein n=1 Tax=Pelagovum pacificum TaxID=2588711 RepID=A0A5C5GCW2_9RHOB|nr:hypothetical protein [Pelagovum pacificum]TNY31827.1 hypothetical protein FHY64_00540 [Pelagovum pacificum]
MNRTIDPDGLSGRLAHRPNTTLLDSADAGASGLGFVTGYDRARLAEAYVAANLSTMTADGAGSPPATATGDTPNGSLRFDAD